MKGRSIALMLVGLIVFGASLAAPTSPAPAQCARWDLTGSWEFQLENGRRVGFNLKQVGCKPPGSSCQFILDGRATYSRPRRADGDGSLAIRKAEGTVRGSKFTVGYVVDDLPEVDYENVYFEGVVGADGSLSGRGPDDPDNPKAWMKWREGAGRKASCLPDIKVEPPIVSDDMKKPLDPADLGIKPKPRWMDKMKK